MKAIIDLADRQVWLIYSAQLAVLVLAAWVLRILVIRFLRRWAARTQNILDDAVVRMLDRSLGLLLLLWSLAAVLSVAPLSGPMLLILNRLVYAAMLGVALYFGVRAAQLVLHGWLLQQEDRASLAEPVRFIGNVLLTVIGVTLVLDNLGVSLTAVWTTLGVGSVAIALALQDTLSNFFAGVYLRLDSPVRVGDYVKLDSGEEGYVVQLGWRSTRIQTLPGNLVIVPNGKIAAANVTNYSLPEPAMSLLIPIGVSYEAEPQRVEEILIEEASRAAHRLPGLLAEPAPFVRFIPGFGDSSLNFTLICRVATFVDQYLVQHELRKQILTRFRREGIEIPFPQRDLHLRSFESLPLAKASGSSGAGGLPGHQ